MIDNEQDSHALEAWLEAFDVSLGMSLQTLAAVFIISIVAGVGIAGAVNYNAWLVAIASISFIFDIAYGIAMFNITMILMGMILFYPHLMLFLELITGTVSPETYPEEETACLSCL